jgi:hypothetical protein
MLIMKKLLSLIIFCTLCFAPAHARWASFEDAAIKSSRSEEITVDKTGRLEGLIEEKSEILKEQGRAVAAHYNLTYNGDNAEIKILEAKTIYKGKEYKLDEKLIEDKALASSAAGFDQFRQILLAFPKAEIGAQIYLKYKYTEKRPAMNGFYAGLFSFGEGLAIEKESLKLHSELPLNIVVNDPTKVLKVTQDKPEDFNHLEVTLTRPHFTGVIGEPSSNVLNKKYITYVSVSSLNRKEDLAIKWHAQGYNKVFEQALPKDFNAILDAAAKRTNDVDQINLVTSQLNDKIQYMGDWRSIEGKIIPRPLEQISRTQLGDCKDLAASTAAILTKLGHKAQLVLVRRGVGNYYYPTALPDMSEFNHAIVKVTTKLGKVRWIDPTNFVSMANGTFPDIANKMALVLDAEKPSYERIPSVDSQAAQSIGSSVIEVPNNDVVIETGKVTMRNESALGLTGAELRSTKKTIRDNLFYSLSGEDLEEKNKLSMTLPDLKSRILKDVTFSYSYKQENKLLKTNLGTALKQSYDTLRRLFSTPDYYVQDILLTPHPYAIKTKTVIKNVKVKAIESLNKEIKSPWVYVNRQCHMKDDGLHIDYDMVIYKNLIPNEETKQPEFLALKKELEKNFMDVAIVFDKAEGKQ